MFSAKPNFFPFEHSVLPDNDEFFFSAATALASSSSAASAAANPTQPSASKSIPIPSASSSSTFAGSPSNNSSNNANQASSPTNNVALTYEKFLQSIQSTNLAGLVGKDAPAVLNANFTSISTDAIKEALETQESGDLNKKIRQASTLRIKVCHRKDNVDKPVKGEEGKPQKNYFTVGKLRIRLRTLRDEKVHDAWIKLEECESKEMEQERAKAQKKNKRKSVDLLAFRRKSTDAKTLSAPNEPGAAYIHVRIHFVITQMGQINLVKELATLPHYNPLYVFFQTLNPQQYIHFFDSLKYVPSDYVVRSVLTVLHSMPNFTDMEKVNLTLEETLLYLVEKEVAAVESEKTLFRRNSIATRLITSYMNYCGGALLIFAFLFCFFFFFSSSKKFQKTKRLLTTAMTS